MDPSGILLFWPRHHTPRHQSLDGFSTHLPSNYESKILGERPQTTNIKPFSNINCHHYQPLTFRTNTPFMTIISKFGSQTIIEPVAILNHPWPINPPSPQASPRLPLRQLLFRFAFFAFRVRLHGSQVGTLLHVAHPGLQGGRCGGGQWQVHVEMVDKAPMGEEKLIVNGSFASLVMVDG